MKCKTDCRRCVVGGPYTPGQCRRCWLAYNTTEYARLWGKPEPANPQPARQIGGVLPSKMRGKCLYLGDPLEKPSPDACRRTLLHACDLGLPDTRPGFECQVCAKWSAEYDPGAVNESVS